MMLLNPYRFAPSGGGDSDPYWANVVSLLHFDGVDGSTTITDEKGKVWTPAGNAQLDTAQKAFGDSSLLLDGSGDYIVSQNVTDFGMGAGDFTLEAWVRVSSYASAQVVFECRAASGQAGVFAINAGTGKIEYYDQSSGSKLGSIAVPLDTFTHVEWSRVSGVLYMFVGGALAFSGALGVDMGASRAIRIGASFTGADYLNGHVDEARITRGVGRHTSSFTPPTAPFPNS